MVKVEYKVKKTLVVDWETLPVKVIIGIESRRRSAQRSMANGIGIAIARGENAIEVRWNFEGSYQGHYCGGIA